MSAFESYDLYRATGLDWVESIPADWELRKLGLLFHLQRRSVADGSETVTAFRDGEVTLRRNRRVEGFTEADKEIGYQGIRDGDLVIHNMDAFAGAIGVSDSNGKSTPVYSVATPSPGQNAKYFSLLLRHLAITGYITALARGIRERSTDFRWATARELLVPVPSKAEQDHIVKVLARETAEIDAFIADQEELIGLLAERRAATISHAVTKGLDPTVPMKDSGVEWLGEIPETWDIRRIKQFVSVPVTDGPHETPEIHDDGIPFVSAEAVGSGMLNMEKIRGFISAEDNAKYSQKYSPKFDDIYMVKSGATTGVVAIVDIDTPFNIWSPLAAIRCGDGAHARFVMYALKSLQFQESVRLHWNFGTQQNIGMSVIENLPIAFPTYDQQLSIATRLDQETAELDATIADAKEAIALSRERRAALISAAVTGKIDVREHGAVA